MVLFEIVYTCGYVVVCFIYNMRGVGKLAAVLGCGDNGGIAVFCLEFFRFLLLPSK